MDETCEPEVLENTYRNFAYINRVVSRWHYVYKHYLRPLAVKTRPLELLDVGFGGGDVIAQLCRWAQQDGVDVRIHAIDSDARALEYVQKHRNLTSVTFEHATSRELVSRGQKFDAVISNHLLHHLDESSVHALCQDSRYLSRHLVVHNDLERSALAYAGFGVVTAPLFRRSFIREDGLISIRRSFSKVELEHLAPAGWQVNRLFPYRLLLTYQHSPATQEEGVNAA
jgi:2-polyprenyl-3-methyl-5-hydroxy-6-metoxy-1,4-benzoquinol methylase